MTVEEHLVSLRTYWGSYHDHKERMAYAAATLYLGVTTAVVFNPSAYWSCRVPHWLLVKLAIATIVVGFAFVIWQLRNREIAAAIVGACNILLYDRLHETRNTWSGDLGYWCNVSLPRSVADKLNTIGVADGLVAGPRNATLLTAAAMLVWTVGAIIASCHAA